MSSKQRKPRQSLSQLMSTAKKRAPSTPKRTAPAKKLPMTVKSLSLTPEAMAKLDNLCSAVSETVGRKVPASAIVRALLVRYGDDATATKHLARHIRAERNTGSVIWGKVAKD